MSTDVVPGVSLVTIQHVARVQQLMTQDAPLLTSRDPASHVFAQQPTCVVVNVSPVQQPFVQVPAISPADILVLRPTQTQTRTQTQTQIPTLIPLVLPTLDLPTHLSPILDLPAPPTRTLALPTPALEPTPILRPFLDVDQRSLSESVPWVKNYVRSLLVLDMNASTL